MAFIGRVGEALLVLMLVILLALLGLGLLDMAIWLARRV